MNYTSEQIEAITARDSNLIVAAAAGSGKTAVLVERVVRLMEEGANVDEMLIMTFTKAASADMRRKLSERLYEWAENGHQKEASKQLEKLEYAHICTIDSFCSDIVRSYFEQADCDPAFRIIDDALNERMRQEALTEAVEAAYAEGIGPLGDGRSPEEIKEMALKLSDFLDKCVDPDEWYKRAMSLAESDGCIWKEECGKLTERKLKEAVSLLSLALKYSEAPNGPAAYRDIIAAELEDVKRLISMSPAERAGCGDIFGDFRKKKAADSPEKEACVKTRKKAKTCVDEALEGYRYDYASSLSDVRADITAFEKLYSITSDMRSRLWSAKKEVSGMTFSDVAQRTLMVLGDRDIAAAVGGRFKYIFVDEYQDTSDLQEELVQRIKGVRNLFMVGDVKQSIYRFRGAVPRIFQEKCEEYKKGGENRRLVLSKNFRSSENVLACINRIFKRVMNGGGSEIIYDTDAELHYGENFKGANVPCEILLAQSGEGDGKSDLSNTELEGRMIAKRINELMAEDRTLRYRDICVLARRGTHFPELAQVLSDNGIKAYTEKGENLYDELEIQLVMSVLRLAVSGMNDLDVIAVLRSPLAGLTTAEIAQLRADNPYVTMWKAVCKSADAYPGCGKLVKLIDELRLYAYGTAINRVIRILLEKTGLYAFVGALEGGARRQGNLDILCRNACRFEKEIGGSLADFVEYAANLAKNKDTTGAHEMGEGDDVVRIMTDHKSKGLQFRVVFAAGLDGKLVDSGHNESPMLKLDRDLGWALLHTDTELGTCRETLVHRAMKSVEYDKTVAEELRILYVTLTRAEERLIMSGVVKDAAKLAESWREMSAEDRPDTSGYVTGLDVVCPALAGCAGAELLGKKAESGAPMATVRVFTEEDFAGNEGEQGTDAADSAAYPDDEWLKQSVSWQYPEQERPYAPVKLAVTGLEREFTGGKEMPVIHAAPAFMSGDEKNNPAGRGTAVHQALRNIDYDRLRKADDIAACIDEQLLEMADDGRLLPEETDMITLSELTGFFESDVGVRVLAADTVKCEWSFCLRMPTNRVIEGYPDGNEIFVQGTIDLCFIEDGEWVLVDYKTSRTRDEKKLIDRYSSQINIYAEALETITGIRVKEAMLCLVSAGRVIRMQPQRWEKHS